MTLTRNTQREGARLLTNTMTKDIYEMMAPWRNVPDTIVIDNSHMSVTETVAAIDLSLAP